MLSSFAIAQTEDSSHPGYYSGKLGANVYSNGVEFSIWWRGDLVSAVSVKGSWSDQEAPMTRITSGDNTDIWWAFVSQAKTGDQYKFRGYRQGAAGYTEVADPYSQYNRYSNGSSVIVDHTFTWTDASWRRPAWADYIIYELHVKDFTSSDPSVSSANRGKYLGVKEKMPYLKSLGITAIEVMPVSEFADVGYSWGYNTCLFFAAESGYAVRASVGQEGVDQLKEMINEAHKYGIAVIMDMVFNHTSNSDNWLWTVDNQAYFSGSTPWGNRLNTSHPIVRRLGRDCIEYFMRKFHVDGFRFDATGNGWIDYNFLYDLKNHAKSIDSNVFFVYENLPNNSGLKTWGAQWADGYRDKGTNLLCHWNWQNASGFASQIFYSRDEGWASCPVESVNYLESHDEDTLSHLYGLAGLNTEAKRWRARQSAVLLTTSLGLPMLWMGQEFLRAREGQNTNEMPLDWSLKNTYQDILAYYSAVLTLRRDNPALRLVDTNGFRWQYEPWNGDSNVIGYSLQTNNSGDKKFVVLLNFNDGTRTVNLRFPENGTWTKVITETSTGGTSTIEVSGYSAQVSILGNSGIILVK